MYADIVEMSLANSEAGQSFFRGKICDRLRRQVEEDGRVFGGRYFMASEIRSRRAEDKPANRIYLACECLNSGKVKVLWRGTQARVRRDLRNRETPPEERQRIKEILKHIKKNKSEIMCPKL